MKKTINITGAIIILFFVGFGVYSLFIKKDVAMPLIKTKVEYKTIIDTIYKTKITPPKTVYVYKKKDSIIYRTAPDFKEPPMVVKANEYSTTLTSNNATAELKIVTTGELLDVKGIITYKEKNTTTETFIKTNNNCLYLYGETSILPSLETFKIGVDYTIKNKFIIGINAGYNVPHNYGSLNLKIGYKIF